MARKINLYRKKGKLYRRRRYKKASPTNVMGPLSTKLPTKMVYEDTFTLNPGVAGTASQYVFSANGLYDPNITGTGHQPRGFDQLMTLYDHYVVIGSKITAWVTNNDTSESQMITLHVQDSTTTQTDPLDIMERRYIKAKQLAPEGTGGATGNIAIKVNPNKFLGRSKPLSDPDLKGNASNNPSEQAYFVLSAFPMLSGADTSTLHCRVRLEFQAILIEPKQPTSS